MSGVLEQPPALIVGLSIQGLAVARSLARAGVSVYCLARRELPLPPAARTRFARVLLYEDLSPEGLPETLLSVAASIGSRGKVVLFPTNDRAVQKIATDWAKLSDHFLLSWSACRDVILRLQRKDNLPGICEASGILYPETTVLASEQQGLAVAAHLTYPVIVKPAMPMSRFKAIVACSPRELSQCVATYVSELPLVVQRRIEGPEPSLYSCTAYVARDGTFHSLASRKLAAYPPGLGQGTVFETVACPEVQELAGRLVDSAQVIGPVAVEFKRDSQGRFWMIEPNIGRSEYCVDLAIHAGLDIPRLEYLDAIGDVSKARRAIQVRPAAWFDTDKDPWCAISYLTAMISGASRRRKLVFPYFGHGDYVPLIVSLWQQSKQLIVTAISKAWSKARGGMSARQAV